MIGRLIRVPALAALLLALAACSGVASPSEPSAPAPAESEPIDAGCPNPEGGQCLGPLTADEEYTTEVFTPQLTYSAPEDGWRNYEDTPGNFLLVPPDNDLPGVNAATSDFIGVYTSVAASQMAPGETCVMELLPEVPRTPQGMADWMLAQPVLSVTEPADVTVGGLTGLMVDVRTQPGAELPSCTDSGTSVSVFVLFSGVSPSSLDHGVVPDMTMRLYMLDYNGGVLMIEISDIDSAPGDLAGLSAVAEQLQFSL